jgi:predicted permease
VGSGERWKFWKRRSDADVADEIAAHLQLEADNLEREGLPAGDAHFAARRAFGNVTGWKERIRESHRILALDNVARDARYAWRGLRRSKTFTISVVLMLAIGIGANAAVISVIDAGYLRKLPVPEPGRLFRILSGDMHNHGRKPSVEWNSFPDYLDLRARIAGTEGLAAYAMQTLPLGDSLAGIGVWSALVSGNYFQVLGVHPARGRFIRPDEEEPRGTHPVVVLSYTMWKSRFAGDEQIIGKMLAVGAGRFTIIGVAPSGFTGTHPEGRTDLWLPFTMQAEATGKDYWYDNRDARVAAVVGRLAPTATLAQVQGSVDQAARELAATYPDIDKSLGLRAVMRDRLISFERAPGALVTFLLILAMVGLLHLVACSNIASLMLARASARRQELGIRLSLGASRGRIVMHSLAEPALLALLGAAGGVIVARWLTLLITGMEFLSAMDSGLNVRVVVIVALVTAATVFQFGMLPALATLRSDPLATIRGSSGSRVAGRKDRVAPFLVMSQVAVSLILLANAAALVRSFQRQATGDLGYDATHIMTAHITTKTGVVMPGDWATRIDELSASVSAIPGVAHVAASTAAPLRQGGRDLDVTVTGHQYAEGESRKVSVQSIGPGYFSAIGASMVKGREFVQADRAGDSGKSGVDVVVVNESMARHYWPGEDPVGRQIVYRGRFSATVVGVVHDLRDVSLVGAGPRAYFPLFEMPLVSQYELIVRTSGDPGIVRPMLRTVVTDSSPLIAAPEIHTMDELVDGALSISRTASIGLTSCAAIALLLTVIGLYGLVASWSAERRNEIGIRLALGAQAWQVTQLLVGGVVRLVAVGAAIGLVGAVAIIRIERGAYGPSISLEWWLISGAVLLLVIATAIAAYIPSRRASSVDPAKVLQSG